MCVCVCVCVICKRIYIWVFWINDSIYQVFLSNLILLIV